MNTALTFAFAGTLGAGLALFRTGSRPSGEPSPPPSLLPFITVDRLERSVSSWQPSSRAAAYLDRVRQAESKHRIPHNLLARLIEQESNWNPDAFNGPTGASGIAQIVPRWHPTVNNPFDPTEAIDYAGFYLRQLFNNFGTWDRALAAYNWGWGNVDHWIASGEQFAALPRETQSYVTDITGDIPV